MRSIVIVVVVWLGPMIDVGTAATLRNGKISFAHNATFYRNKPQTILNILTHPDARSGHLELVHRLVTDVAVPDPLYKVVFEPKLHEDPNLSRIICVLIARYKRFDVNKLVRVPRAMEQLLAIALGGSAYIFEDSQLSHIGSSAFIGLHILAALVSHAHSASSVALQLAEFDLSLPVFSSQRAWVQTDIEYTVNALLTNIDLIRLIRPINPKLAQSQLVRAKADYENFMELSESGVLEYKNYALQVGERFNREQAASEVPLWPMKPDGDGTCPDAFSWSR